ncbi:MAG: HesB/IscA family protein [Pseudonocardiaceae bacterium]
MLSITETAAEAINTLISDNDMPDGSGLRIAAQPDRSGGLQLSVTPAPGEQDTVVEGGGATVFLEPVAAQALDGQLLDVHRDEDQYQFAITPRASA